MLYGLNDLNKADRQRQGLPEKVEGIMKIEFTDSEYRFEHGHAPKGRGCWIFEFEGMDYTARAGQTLMEAKKEVKEQIKNIAPKGYIGTVYVNIAP